MRANEFIKKFGWDHAVGFYIWATENKSVLAPDNFPLTVFHGESVYYLDLKRYIDAYDMVQDLYGLDRAKEYANSKYTAPEIAEPLKQAITLVEECQ